jgi:hypothetical protein
MDTVPPDAPWENAPNARFCITVTVIGRGGGSCAIASCDSAKRIMIGRANKNRLRKATIFLIMIINSV